MSKHPQPPQAPANAHIERAIQLLGSGVELASVLDRSPQFVSQLRKGERPVPQDLCPLIEKATKGEVTCEQLLGNVQWYRVRDKSWPHPAGRPLVDVAASAQQA
ncbi:transcriptional regulator [Caldimonas brevitalea]|uniref:transcriptional regulator n=1 Tax=Caldimonas brevitalea TaxID=413882 RepID=UPI0009FA1771|nr:YdaS family helix-turn-helix protein [Caldimonas brevitalea]